MIGKDHLYAISATRFFGWHAFEVQSNLANFLPLTSNFVIGIFLRVGYWASLKLMSKIKYLKIKSRLWK